MSIGPTAPTPTERATSDPTPLVPTDATDQVTAEHVTAREIAEFLHHLAEVSADVRSDAGDPDALAAFLHRKAELFTRLTADLTNPPTLERHIP